MLSFISKTAGFLGNITTSHQRRDIVLKKIQNCAHGGKIARLILSLTLSSTSEKINSMPILLYPDECKEAIKYFDDVPMCHFECEQNKMCERTPVECLSVTTDCCC